MNRQQGFDWGEGVQGGHTWKGYTHSGGGMGVRVGGVGGRVPKCV